MRYTKRTLLIAVLICGGFLPVFSAQTTASRTKRRQRSAWELLRKQRQEKAQAAAGEDKQPTPDQAKPGPATALDLLDEYTKALDSLRSVIVKAEITSTHAGAFSRDFRDPDVRGLADRGTSYRRTELRTDGKRSHWREYLWGHISSTFPSIPEEQAHYYCHNWDGEQLYSYRIAVNNPESHGIAHFYKPPKNEDKGGLSRKFPASYLMGYNLENDERMDSILRRAKSISVRQKTERIGGSDCYVIDAKTDSGRILLWIDPAHGYHPAKAETRLAPGDLVFGNNRLPKGDGRTTRLQNVRFRKVDDIWVPIEADAYMDRHFGGRNHTTQTWHYKRTEVVVNPDHEALGSFDNPLENPRNDPELKNGADVCIRHMPGDHPQYVWQDGRVVDKTGKVIMDSQPKQKSDSKESQSETLGKKPPSAWDLRRKEQQRKLQATAGADKQRAPDQAKPEPPVVADLLDKLTEALDSAGSTSFIAKGESTQEHEYRFSKNYREPGLRGVRDKGTCYRREEFRTDGERYHLRQYSWGHISSQDSSVPEDRPIFYCLNYAAENELYRHSVRINPGQPGGIVMISKLDSSKMSHMDYRLQGYVLPSHERADLILRRAESISVRPKTEKIGASECYVIDAKTDCGRVSLWIDPGRGYHLARAEVRATQGDLEDGRPLRAGQVLTIRLDGFRFEKVKGVWVPMELDMSSDLDYGGGSFTRSKTHYKRTGIVLNPDHDTLGSFDNPLENPKNDPELKNGTFVRKDGSRYIWQDGKLAPDESRSGGRSNSGKSGRRR
jgi:hypothetical protein